MIRINNVVLPPPYSIERARLAAAEAIKTASENVFSVTVVKKSIDARNKSNIFYLLALDCEVADERRYYSLKNVSRSEKYEYDYPPVWRKKTRPVVVGSGPAGLFCALILAYRGANPIVIERGKSVEERVKDVTRFWKTGELSPDSNVQFGEGGAGTFSDGKLNTGTRDSRQRKVLTEMVAAGAPESILYESKPHVGTDNLRIMTVGLRNKIISLGGEFLFNCALTDIVTKNGAVAAAVTEKGEILTDTLVLAIGHSARDTFEMLQKKGTAMERKPFSAGVRIEHKREFINRAQYGSFAPILPDADYKFAYHMPSGRGVYTFCMCPGGVVVPAASEEQGVVVNGMSNYARDAENSNSAVLVSLLPEDFEGSDPLEAVRFQRKLEKSAFYQAGASFNAPAQKLGDFFEGKRTSSFGVVVPSYEIGVTPSDLKRLLPKSISDGIEVGIRDFSRRLKGFDMPDAVLTGVETRSSSPVRILRGEDFSSSIKGLFPIGEGAGYAGGIMSAAVDGIKAAEKI